ncbi:MAG: sensor histidine kinase [Sphingomonadales bacterium]|nr:sensor histidine kinase [Sphingomonadales bacterium]
MQFRQLVDLIGTMPAEARGAAIDRAMLRLGELAAQIPAPERAMALARSGVRLRNPRLVAELCCDHPAVAAATIACARLTDEQWLDLIPALPGPARDRLLQRDDLGAALRRRLERLGAASPGLPGPDTATVAAPQPASAIAESAPPSGGAKVLPLRARTEAPPAAPAPSEPVIASPSGAAAPSGEGIGAIVRRIEAFRRNREATRPAANDAPRLPLGEDAAPPQLQAFGFACDSAGRISWTDATVAGMAVGLLLPLADAADGTLASAFRRRLPVRGTLITLEGAPAITGTWLLDAAPEFDRDGRFTGYTGKFRRPGPAKVPVAEHPEAVRVRQVLHELRTPVNAIQGFAELIQQQLVGPVPHTYRALAASIAADAAQMLAGFEELDRLARLDMSALLPEPGEADLGATIAALIDQLDPFTRPRQSGFLFTAPATVCSVALARDEVERLGWRLLATLAGVARPGERLAVELGRGAGMVTLSIALPEAMAAVADPFESAVATAGQTVSGGLFGTGFALRLAGAEARGAGGSLAFGDHRAILTLPAAPATQLTEPAELPNPNGAGASSMR